MTRGRRANTAHLVADTPEDARAQWIDIFNRDRADLGPAHAAQRAADDVERYGPNKRPASAVLQAAALPTRQTTAGRSRHWEEATGTTELPTKHDIRR